MSVDLWGKEPLIDGAALLDDVETFLGRFIAYPSDAARVAHTLWIAHAWFMETWESTPRIAFLSPEPGSGKSRCLEVTEPLVPRAVHAVNTTPAYLFRKVSDEAGPPTILFDEIDTVFGPKAKDNEEVRGMLNAGHRRGATAGRCVVVGKIVKTEELPAYCAVALAGLNDLPDTIMTRSVIVRMRRRAPDETVEPWRHRINGPQAAGMFEQLGAWSAQSVDDIMWPDMPSGIEDRNADVWEPLLAVADLAGSAWPDRARVAAVALVAAAAGQGGSMGIQLLRDVRDVFAGADAMATEAILAALHEIDESPWADLRGKPLDARGLSRRLAKYDVKPRTIRVGEHLPKGYRAEDLYDSWARYLPSVADVADVADLSGPTGPVVADVVGPLWKLRDTDIKDMDSAVGTGVPVAPRESATSATPQQTSAEQPRSSPASEPVLCRCCRAELSRFRSTRGFTTCVAHDHLDALSAATVSAS